MKARGFCDWKFLFAAVFCSVLFLIPVGGFAQEEKEESVLDKVQWQAGPVVAEMDGIAEIQLPAGYVFANGSDTRMLMEAMGNPASDTEVGFIAPESMEWFVVFEFDDVGYIKDDEKDSLDADAIIDSIREGTEASNKARRDAGYPGLSVEGWEVKPQYNEVTKNLEWAIRAKDDEGDIIINHNTRILGRKGVMRATLVANPDIFTSVLPTYRDKLDGFSFMSGHKYAEYTKGDKIAKFGLAALVAGGAGAAAAKFGLFKLLGKFGKFILIGIVGLFAGFRKKIANLFGRGSRGEA